MRYERAIIFAAGLVLGAGAYALIQSSTGRKAAVAVLSKGLELKEKVETMTERAKESLEDVVAEASFYNEQKKRCCTAPVEDVAGAQA